MKSFTSRVDTARLEEIPVLHRSPISRGTAASRPSEKLVLYCARHDYGTRVLMRTGNLSAVMRTMGHRDVKTAMHYQHPELDVVRAALDCGAATETAEMRA